jgi:hypothetical protein
MPEKRHATKNLVDFHDSFAALKIQGSQFELIGV